MPSHSALLAVTGASGAGKTTLVRALEALRLPGVGCYYFDTIGVPSPEEMERRFGGGDPWRAYALDQWIERLARNDDGVEVAVLDDQVPHSQLREAFARHGVRHARIVLVDCDHGERNARLCGPRCQPELATPRMDCWAAYLRGQADALGHPVLDSSRPIPEAVAELAAHVRALAELRRAAAA